MSSPQKRIAEEAFPEDKVKSGRSPPAKKRKSRSSRSHKKQDSLVEDKVSENVKLSPLTTSQKVKKFKTKTSPSKTRTEKGKNGQQEKWSEKHKIKADPATHPDENETIGATTNAEPKLTKTKRSKRKQKPQFDQSNSQIELILSKSQHNEGGEHEKHREDGAVTKSSKHGEESRKVKQGSKPDKKHKKRQSKIGHQGQIPSSEWSISEASGGVFIDHDPVMTPDEEHIILATKQTILVYSKKTSLLVRTISVGKKAQIVTYCQIPTQDQYIVIGLSNGVLSKFDWTTGRKVWSAALGDCITAVASTSSSTASDGLLMVLRSEDGTSSLISLALDKEGSVLGRRQMLKQKDILQHICFSAELGIAVVASRHTVYVGRLADNDKDKETPLRWHETAITGKISCFDAQIFSPPQNTGKGKEQPTVNFAVGLKSGEIQLLDNVLNRIGNSQNSSIHARRLHWHRAAPRTVKFSPDSNYLVSGGDETVLVIWQLDTNQKQTLPHLTSTILNVAISRQGSAYAVRLADNSVMVLSTSDLQPVANISGLAWDASYRAPFSPGQNTPAVMHPKHPDRLLLAYSSQSLNPTFKPSEKAANMLQTYDVAAQLQLSRQALARNLMASVNIGADGLPLHEPNVTHLELSYDGNWLITVDQWSEGGDESKGMYLSRGDQWQREQSNECFLRFWVAKTEATNGAADYWELNTRIDEPVLSGQSAPTRRILAVAVSPLRHQVAVADSTRHVKIYSPKARVRNGVPVKNSERMQLVTWTCDSMISLQETSLVSDPKSAALVFSGDGSVLAASWPSSSPTKARVHLLDPKTGTMIAALPEVVTAGKSQLAFAGQNLLALSNKFCIYDTVAMQETFAIYLEDKFDPTKSRLAVNTRSGFVAVLASEREARQPSRLVLLDINSSENRAMLDEQLYPQVHVLLSNNTDGGFVVIDGEGRTKKIVPPGSLGKLLAIKEAAKEKVLAKSSLEDVFGSDRKVIAPPGDGQKREANATVLEKIFEMESSAHAPGPRDLFNQVALVVAGAAA